ncbi:MAG: hypothetical protein AAGD07_10760, partial [Planctomycetota bacterium]
MMRFQAAQILTFLHHPVRRIFNVAFTAFALTSGFPLLGNAVRGQELAEDERVTAKQGYHQDRQTRFLEMITQGPGIAVSIAPQHHTPTSEAHPSAQLRSPITVPRGGGLSAQTEPLERFVPIQTRHAFASAQLGVPQQFPGEDSKTRPSRLPVVRENPWAKSPFGSPDKQLAALPEPQEENAGDEPNTQDDPELEGQLEDLMSSINRLIGPPDEDALLPSEDVEALLPPENPDTDGDSLLGDDLDAGLPDLRDVESDANATSEPDATATQPQPKPSAPAWRLSIEEAVRIGLSHNRDIAVVNWLPGIDAAKAGFEMGAFDPVIGAAMIGGEDDRLVRSQIATFGAVVDFLKTDSFQPFGGLNQ